MGLSRHFVTARIRLAAGGEMSRGPGPRNTRIDEGVGAGRGRVHPHASLILLRFPQVIVLPKSTMGTAPDGNDRARARAARRHPRWLCSAKLQIGDVSRNLSCAADGQRIPAMALFRQFAKRANNADSAST
jgi:hypothetical protein